MMNERYLATVIDSYRYLLQPVPPFTWFGSEVSIFDVGAAFRLCIVLRQLREMRHRQYLESERDRKNEASGIYLKGKEVEEASRVKNIMVALIVVYGGEGFMNPWLGISPSFIFSPTIPALYAALTVLADSLPWVPAMSLWTELPLSIFDGLTRSFLLCQLIPPAVMTHSSPTIALSPWTLILASLVTANGGFFLVNLFDMLNPTGFSLSTPAEFQAFGWTTVDLWCAPVTTSLYALLTHAQPFWTELHALILQFVSSYVPEGYHTGLGIIPGSEEKAKSEAQAVDPEIARAACAIFLMTLFMARTVRNFGGQYLTGARSQKKKVMRSNGNLLKTKIQ